MNCAAPVVGVRQHVVEHGDRLARHFQRLHIERRREERSIVHIQQMSARRIATVIALLLDDRACAVNQRLDDQRRLGVLPALPLAVKSTARPPGSTCGQRCVASPWTAVIASAGVPPDADTRRSPVPSVSLGDKTRHNSSVFRPTPATAIRHVTQCDGGAAGHCDFLQLVCGKEANPRPSGEKKGLCAPSVPARGEACTLVKRSAAFTVAWCRLPLLPRGAEDRPGRETTLRRPRGRPRPARRPRRSRRSTVAPEAARSSQMFRPMINGNGDGRSGNRGDGQPRIRLGRGARPTAAVGSVCGRRCWNLPARSPCR